MIWRVRPHHALTVGLFQVDSCLEKRETLVSPSCSEPSNFDLKDTLCFYIEL
ncbi:hypothetical protein MNB_SV-14-176 [hydrothermal vent metagenome]|uniref:Uncharacterized protein n=1 Tax=hydrothermal vent metagenome TaxID=652676 RepID=A0A1W1BY99_9ZZZZ